MFDQSGAPESVAAASSAVEKQKSPPRIEKVAGSRADIRAFLGGQLAAAVTTLPRMWRAAPEGSQEGSPEGFVFRLRGGSRATSARDLVAEGTSLRYGAIVALGARHLDEADQRGILAGQIAPAFVDQLVGALTPQTNPGDIAMVAWAAAAAGAESLGRSLDHLSQAADRATQIVPISWAVSAFTAAGDEKGAQAQRDRLLAAYSAPGQLFPHVTDVTTLPWYRRFLGCFADQVYPIQALARFHRAFGDPEALEAAERCARQICYLQGGAGQWWWHYDWRTGAVAEEYPVYAVHQNAMAPMALLDLADAGGTVHDEAIRAGLRWLAYSPEIGTTLVDERLGVTWRKVARKDRGKLVRGARGAAIGMNRRARLGALDVMFTPRAVDYETRPYELGWLLDAWLAR
ncbi:hypothetical protein I6A84_28965 [Frankia sp. CNm7]|uniref:Uncharacterized protein n=1 Tax=Frankia nepalensis TaxID=1836974 RepID=A0A937R9L0_9ACTN|nr:hypothetical protein [Frankia nepalensis]MBL7501233.1 hypothetical protein [Frankia nepalensis]MBL7512782.1 hypothetical protein [Frankia nepalensis]MBL7522002.1 hypothetical protein [Frankia nepalensis]MBL7626405.1 hypothetical protein [Frankia nepalensis]